MLRFKMKRVLFVIVFKVNHVDQLFNIFWGILIEFFQVKCVEISIAVAVKVQKNA